MKRAALALDLPILQPEKIKNNEEFHRQLAEMAPEAIIVVGYGRIIPQWMIDLPRWATSTCTARCCQSIAAPRRSSGPSRMGENITGVTTMRIDAGLDTGDILLQEEERDPARKTPR